MDMRTVNPEGWLPPRGYSNGIVAEGKLLFVAGQIGWDPRANPPTFPETFSAQFEVALQNIVEVVQAAGGTAQNVTRLTIYVTDKREYNAQIKEVGAAFRKVMGKHYPVMALLVVAGLLEDKAKVEIEATAVL